ncbi:hypothetical protein L1277_001734 [Okibacterium sp. HSC-33S16]|nr:hypothetical protein [Okibacterium sp. HSC-33S16]
MARAAVHTERGWLGGFEASLRVVRRFEASVGVLQIESKNPYRRLDAPRALSDVWARRINGRWRLGPLVDKG